MKAWKPGCMVVDDVDEYYEPLERQERVLAAKITLTIRLAMHRADEKEKQDKLYRPNIQTFGRIKRPTQQPE